MHILITGGAGFLGSNLVEYHLNNADHVHVLDDLSTGSLENITEFIHHPRFHFTQADMTTWSELNTAVAWADRIYHLAAVVGVYRVISEPSRVLEVNINATQRLLDAARLAMWKPHIILASTSEVYGNSTQESLVETASLVIGGNKRACINYNISKLTDEALGLAYAAEYNLPITILRIFNMIGKKQTGSYGMVVPRFVAAAVQNKPITIYGTGEQTRSFCDVRDFVAMVTQLADNPKACGEVTNIGHAQEISIKNLAILTKELANSQSPLQYVPYKDAYGPGFEDMLFRRPDLNKLHGFIAYKPLWTLETTLMDLIEQQR